MTAASLLQERLNEQYLKTQLQKLRFRIGLDIGEVFADGENLLGEAVNFASRLESFAQPSGISISHRFRQSLRVNRVEFRDHGIQTIKNSRIHCLDVLLPNLEKRRILSASQKNRIKLGAITILIFLLFSIYQQYFTTNYERSTVAVLPVLNQTGDPTLDYIASGLTSEISGAISKISTLNVISDSSVNVTFSDNATIEQVSQELSLDHLLFGYLSYNGDGIEISIHLYETAENSKEVIYTNLGALNEVLESRSNIFNAIINTIDVPISKIERINATRLGTTNFEAYEEFLKGDYNFKLRTQEGTFAAKNHFENAIRIDPNFARPYGYLALVFNRIASPNSAISLTAQERQNRIYFADFISLAATSIGSNVPQAYFARAFIETFNLGMHEAALKNSDTAISINPNYADALGLRASILSTLEKPEQALENLKRRKSLILTLPLNI